MLTDGETKKTIDEYTEKKSSTQIVLNKPKLFQFSYNLSFPSAGVAIWWKLFSNSDLLLHNQHSSVSTFCFFFIIFLLIFLNLIHNLILYLRICVSLGISFESQNHHFVFQLIFCSFACFSFDSSFNLWFILRYSEKHFFSYFFAIYSTIIFLFFIFQFYR